MSFEDKHGEQVTFFLGYHSPPQRFATNRLERTVDCDGLSHHTNSGKPPSRFGGSPSPTHRTTARLLLGNILPYSRAWCSKTNPAIITSTAFKGRRINAQFRYIFFCLSV